MSASRSFTGRDKAPRQARSFRPLLERLEERCVMSAEQIALALAATTASTVAVTDDPVLHWNDVMLDANAIDTTLASSDQGGPTRTAWAFGIVSAAVYDAYNSITHTNNPYLTELPGYEAADPTAAVSAAAHAALVALYPQQAARFDDLLAAALASVPDGPAEDLGVQLGEAVAAALLAARANDGSGDMMTYMPTDAVGRHGADPENPDQGFLTPNWGAVDPFVIPDATLFRAARPPALKSLDYALAYRQVKALGGDGVTTPTRRTAEQTEIGIFWAYDGAPALGTPPRLYNQIAVTIAQDQETTPEQNARLLALVNLALADAGIQCWESKYYYDYWRPILGIRQGANDRNALTAGDPNWTPLGAPLSNGMAKNFTPPFPSYSSGHATFGTAALRVIGNFFGTSQIPFSFQSDEFNGVTTDVNVDAPRPVVTRHYANLDQAIEENAIARVYLGVHWIFDQTNGMKCGKLIADYVTAHALLPRDLGGNRVLHIGPANQALDLRVVIGADFVRVLDRRSGRLLESRASDQIDQIVIHGSAKNDRVLIVFAANACVLARGIQIAGGAGRDEVQVEGSWKADTVLSQPDTLVWNGTAIHTLGVEKLKPKAGWFDELRKI